MLISPVTTEDDQRMIETCLVFLKMLSFFFKNFSNFTNINSSTGVTDTGVTEFMSLNLVRT